MKIKTITNKKIWEDFVLNHPQGNFLQSYNWGQFQHQLGKKVFRLGFYKQTKLLGLVQLIKEEARRGTYLACPGGPLLDDQLEAWPDFISLIKKIGQLEAAVFVRVRPQYLDKETVRLKFRLAGFRPAPMHMHAETTWQLDLDQTEDGLLKNMRKNTRSAVKKAQASNLRVNFTQKPEAVDRLYQLQIKTAQRHQFVPFSKKFLRMQFKTFSQDNQATIIEIYYQNQLACSAMFIFYGREGIYHYSGSTQLAYQTNASYLLLWQAILEAKKRGLKRFNFWGVVPRNQPHHRFWGVTVFKRGFGGFPVDYLHAHDLPLKLSYWPVWLLETWRRVYRRL